MLDKLVLFHQGNNEVFRSEALPPDWVHWSTCLRQIMIGTNDFSQKDLQGEKFLGVQAYQFFLEVICGLHSPIAGETEVMGQFKKLIDGFQSDLNPSGKELNQFFRSALTDAKTVRGQVLRDLGSRSYGSIVRRWVKAPSKIAVIGAGQLVHEMIPWLGDDEIHIFCRRDEVGHELKAKFKNVVPHQLSLEEFQRVQSSALIVAAPISNEIVIRYLGAAETLRQLIDLRDLSRGKPLRAPDFLKRGEILSLSDIFAQMKNTEVQNAQSIARAKGLIAELTQKRFSAVQLRPFGWEDLCG